jgi:DNA-binding MarR family transcriptional regulator
MPVACPALTMSLQCVSILTMSHERTAAGEAGTQVILSTFRANGLLLAAGDLLADDQGLTSARWQILGAIALAERPLTVPQIARRMGLTRQSVHATVTRLVRDGLLELTPNADHRRSQLVRLTEPGTATYSAIDRRQAVWVNRLARGIGRSDLETTARVLDELCRRLEANAAEDTTSDGGGNE